MPLDQRVMRRPKFSDPEVCKHALAGLCPFGERSSGRGGMASVGIVSSGGLPAQTRHAAWSQQQQQQWPRFHATHPACCPALPGLFPNTKSDLGPCEYEIHEDHLDWEAIQGEYDALPSREKDRCGTALRCAGMPCGQAVPQTCVCLPSLPGLPLVAGQLG